MRYSIAFQTDKPLAAYGPLAAQVEAYGFDMVTVYNDLEIPPSMAKNNLGKIFPRKHKTIMLLKISVKL